MISWRNPDARHAAWDFSTYGQAILDAMDASSPFDYGQRVRPLSWEPARAAS